MNLEPIMSQWQTYMLSRTLSNFSFDIWFIKYNTNTELDLTVEGCLTVNDSQVEDYFKNYRMFKPEGQKWNTYISYLLWMRSYTGGRSAAHRSRFQIDLKKEQPWIRLFHKHSNYVTCLPLLVQSSNQSPYNGRILLSHILWHRPIRHAFWGTFRLGIIFLDCQGIRISRASATRLKEFYCTYKNE